MRPLAALAAACLLLPAAFAAAPPAKVPAEWHQLIDQLGEEQTRAAAQKKLEALGEDVVPVLRRAGKTHDDADVRLRATVIAAAIEKELFGEVRVFKHDDLVLVLAVSPDGKRVASGQWQRTSVVRVWDVETGKELLQFTEHRSGGVDALAWSKDGTRILSSGVDGMLRLWDAKTGKTLK